MGLWSCSQDEALPGGQTTAKGHPVPVTLTVSRGDAQTRTELSENLATGGLNDVWESGDKLTVYDADGLYAGELIISDGFGTDTGVFSGTVTAEPGQHEFNVWYTDPEATGEKEADGKPIYFNTKKEMVVDLSKMPKCNEVKDLSKMDILSKKITLNIKDNNATLVKDEKMVAHLAMARFSLNGIPTDKAGTLTVRGPLNSANNTYDGIIYKMRLSLATGTLEGTTTSQKGKGLEIKNVKGGDNVYMAFIPSTYKLSFHMEFDGVNYDYAFKNSTDLKAGVYYNAFTKAEGAEEGTIDGFNIPLQKEALAELHLYANFDGAEPAEIVVVRSFGDKDSYTFDLTQPYESYVGVDNKTLPLRSGYTFKGWSQDGITIDEATAVYKDPESARKAYYDAVWEKTAPKDLDKIFGIKWADYNTQSIIYGNTRTYYLLSYIPYVNLNAQGYPDDYLIGHEDNPNVSFYQWDREFGFDGIYASSGNRYPKLGSLDDYWAPIPGDGYDMGWQFDDGQYWYSNSQCTNNNLSSNFNILYYPTNNNTKDWLKNHTATKWESKMQEYNTSAIPTGFMIPEKSTWEKLLLNSDGKAEKRDFVYNHTADSEPYAFYPIKVVNESDGTTIVWSIETRFDADNNQIWILDIRKLGGTYSLSDLKEDENIILACENPLRLGAYGCLSSTGVSKNYGTEGFYWTANSSSTAGEAYAFHFVIDVTNGTLKTEIVSKPRKEVYSVRCAYKN